MPDTLPSGSGGCFVIPSWWTEPTFTLSEVAEFVATPISTVHLWFALTRAAGHTVGTKRGSRTLYSTHELYVACLLSKLRDRRVPANAMTCFAAFAFATTMDGKPRPLAYNGVWSVYPDEGAKLEVPAWLCWTAARARATKYHGTAHA